MAGESMVAGLLVSILAPPDFRIGILCGLLASFWVLRGPIITHALRLDDPGHHAGMFLLPALSGLLLPGLVDLTRLAEELQWIGAALSIGLLICFAWPLSMLLTGLAASPRRVREGLDSAS